MHLSQSERLSLLHTSPCTCGDNHCPHCLCDPCVIQIPPDFLVGSAGPHPANVEKRHVLYTKFWTLLQDLCVWNDEYLHRKERRTTRDDRKEIMPNCVLKVGFLYVHTSTSQNLDILSLYLQIIQEIRRRYASHDGNNCDYRSTFDAEST